MSTRWCVISRSSRPISASSIGSMHANSDVERSGDLCRQHRQSGRAASRARNPDDTDPRPHRPDVGPGGGACSTAPRLAFRARDARVGASRSTNSTIVLDESALSRYIQHVIQDARRGVLDPSAGHAARPDRPLLRAHRRPRREHRRAGPLHRRRLESPERAGGRAGPGPEWKGLLRHHPDIARSRSDRRRSPKSGAIDAIRRDFVANVSPTNSRPRWAPSPCSPTPSPPRPDPRRPGPTVARC